MKRNLTLNLGLRTDINGAFHDNLCHIETLMKSGRAGLASHGHYCASLLNVPGLTGSGDDSTFKNGYSTGRRRELALPDLGGCQKRRSAPVMEFTMCARTLAPQTSRFRRRTCPFVCGICAWLRDRIRRRHFLVPE